jgi:hypothetical protein
MEQSLSVYPRSVKQSSMYLVDIIKAASHGLGQRSQYSNSLQAGMFGDQIPVGVRFSAPIQTGPGANPPSCTMGTGSFPGVKAAKTH